MIGKRLAASFRHAGEGLKQGWRHERNLRIFTWMAVLVVLAMLGLKTSRWESALLVLTMMTMFGLELLNSQIERFLGLVAPQPSESVKKIKDLSAGAVLLGAVGAIIIGGLIFIPHLLELLN